MYESETCFKNIFVQFLFDLLEATKYLKENLEIIPKLKYLQVDTNNVA